MHVNSRAYVCIVQEKTKDIFPREHHVAIVIIGKNKICKLKKSIGLFIIFTLPIMHLGYPPAPSPAKKKSKGFKYKIRST